jgi:hypothetical protein
MAHPDPVNLSGGDKSIIVPAVILAMAAVFAYAWSERERRPPDRFESEAEDADRTRTDSRRGRDAASPGEIPASGWKDVLFRTYEQIGEDRLLAVAAGVVFYGLLALFPAVTALVSSYALFADPKTINDHLSFVADTLPLAPSRLCTIK